MANLFSKPWVVAALAIVALAVVYLRVVGPLLDDTEDVPVIAEDYDDIDEVIDSSEDTGIETVEQGLQFATAQYDLQRVSVDALHWNEAPSRDPFAPEATIDTTDVVNVQEKIDVAAPVTTRKPPVAARLPTVSALVTGSDVQYAVIDGAIRKPGDRVGSWQLIAIEKGAVVFIDRVRNTTRRVRIEQ